MAGMLNELSTLNHGELATRPQSVLRIRDLRMNFGGVKAIDSIDIDVFDDEVVGIIGPNGSGKTTTFNVVSGIIHASGGSILWRDNRELVGMQPWNIHALGISRTFQNIRLPLGLSILENVMVGLYTEERANWIHPLLNSRRLRKQNSIMRERAEEALRFISPSLASASDRLVAELSYADRRRVEIARAIVSKPKLLLLDEPTAGMNAGETQGLAEDIKKLRERGITILLVEHKMKFIGDLADRVIVLNFGRKIAEGSYDTIRRDEQVIEAYLGRRRAAQA